MGHDHGAVSRRTVVVGVIAGLAAAGLSGCQGAWYPSEISPDEYVLRGVITDKTRMIARYEATIAAGEGPVGLLERLLADHRAHLDALRGRMPDHGGQEPEEPEYSPGPSPEPVPDEPVSVAGLRVAEQSAAGSRILQTARIGESGLAQLIASVGACEAGHVHQLAEA
ncbi:hypothetical protein ACFOVU_26180 [Nocardiopsis sediminis]|uniref:Ferritin-like domain-containing protein n=1 Tax=Nocardiopsis sediminis TaxID=1778267 RepID=A0ABV8FTJ2_9ACTN